MSDDLFPDCRHDSPRLAWMKRHGIRIVATDELLIGEFAATDGSATAYGDSEYDALAFLAHFKGIPLWDEEQYAKEKTE